MWTSVVERLERHAPASVMARTALEHALPAGWPDARASSGIDAVFAAHRQRQYPRELLFSTVIELMTLVSLGLRPFCTRAILQGWDEAHAGFVVREHAGHPRLGGYEGMLIALPPEQWPPYGGDPAALAERLLQLARNIDPRHVATARVLAQAQATP